MKNNKRNNFHPEYKKQKFLIFIGVLFLYSISGYAQKLNDENINPELDSIANNVLIIGKKFENNHQLDSALKYYNFAAQHFSNAKNHTKEITTKGVIAYLYFTIANYQSGIKKAIEAIKICEKHQLSENHLLLSYIALGFINRNNSKFEEALFDFKKTLQIAKNTSDTSFQITSYNELGNIYIQINQPDTALKYYKKAISLSKKAGHEISLAYSYNDISHIYLNKNNLHKGLFYLKKSYSLIKNTSSYRELAIISGNIAETYLKLQKPDTAKKYLDIAQINTQKHNSLFLKINYKRLMMLYFRNIGNYKKAYKHALEYKNYDDSLKSIESVEKISELQEKYESEKKAKEIRILKQKEELQSVKIKQKNTLLYSFVGSILLLVLLAYSIYRRYKSKVKTNKILEEQKQEIEAQRNAVTEQRDLIINQKEEIISGITYAKRIQKAGMPDKNTLDKILKNYFVFYRPLNIVSGDFYWVSEQDNKKIMIVADCTGHGVPGAFMSMLGISFLNEIVNDNSVIEPAIILNNIREKVVTTLKQNADTDISDNDFSIVTDGMDMVVCVYDETQSVLSFAGANNPIFIISDEEKGNASKSYQYGKIYINEFKGDKMPVSIYRHMKNYSQTEIKIENKDRLYMFSDGYYDQFGGENYKKLKSTGFKNHLISSYHNNIEKQGENLSRLFDDWKTNTNQIDDVLVIGVEFTQQA